MHSVMPQNQADSGKHAYLILQNVDKKKRVVIPC